VFNSINRKETLRYLSISIILVLGIIVPLLLPSLLEVKQLWKGYYTVIYENENSTDKITSFFRKHNIGPVISKETSQAGFYDFSQFEYIPVQKVDSHFLDEDPRYDEYLKMLPYFFHPKGNKEKNIMYVRSDMPILGFYSFLKKHSTEINGKIRLADISFSWVYAAAFIIILFGMLYVSRSYKLFSFLVSVPWVGAVLFSSYRFFLISVFLYISFIVAAKTLFTYENKDNKSEKNFKNRFPLYVNGFLFLFFFIIGNILISYSRLDMLYLLAAVTGMGVIAYVYRWIIIIRDEKREHPTFRHVRILSWREYDEKIGLPALLVRAGLILLVVAAPFMQSFVSGDQGGRMPIPQSQNSLKGITLSSLKNLSSNKNQNELPNLSDYITHMAFQQSFAYGNREYVFPEKNEEITVPVYEKKEGKIIQKKKIIMVFDEKWMQGVLEKISPGSIESILHLQGKPVTVYYGPRQKQFEYLLVFWYALPTVLALFIPVIFSKLILITGLGYGMRKFQQRREFSS